MSHTDKAGMENTNGKHSNLEGIHSFKQANLERVIPVRLSEEHWLQIKREASQMGIGASTLARIWIVESLRKLGNPAGTRIKREK